MYRKLKTFFEAANILKDFDYFQKQKETALTSHIDVLETVVTKIREIQASADSQESGEFFRKLLKVKLEYTFNVSHQNQNIFS